MSPAYKVIEAVTNYIKEREHFGWGIRGERAVKFGEISKWDFVLDLGCGPGMVAKVIRETVGPSGKIVGIDISEVLLLTQDSFVLFQTCRFLLGTWKI